MSMIKKQMNVLELMSTFPGSITVLKKNGINTLKVLESLEKNILDSGKSVDDILEILEKGFEESKKPVEIDTEKLIDLSEEAAEEFKKLLANKNKKGWAFRVLVHSPSPNKYAYGMEIEKNSTKDDIVVKKHGLKFFVAKKHAKEIEGTKIEYDRREEGFKFQRCQS